MDAISNFAARYARTCEEEMSIDEYLAECKRDPMGLRHIGPAHAGRHWRA